MDKEPMNAAPQDYFAQMDRQSAIGKRIVRVIVILCVVDQVLGFFVNGYISLFIRGSFMDVFINLAWLIFSFFFYYNLYMGKNWAKWWYIVLAGISLIILFVGITQGAATWIWAVQVVFHVVASVILLCSKSVNEFLYRQDVG